MNHLVPIARGLVVLLLPIFELTFFRLFLKYGLHLKIGYSYITDYDFFLPLPIAFLVYFKGLQKRQPFPLAFRRQNLGANGLAALAFLALNVLLYWNPAVGTPLFWTSWLLSLLWLVTSALSVWVPLKIFFPRKQIWLAAAAVVVVFSVPFCLQWNNALWNLFAEKTAFFVRHIFETFWNGRVAVQVSDHAYLSLIHPALKLHIGQGCGGMESSLLFSFIFLQHASLHGRQFSRSTWGLFFAAGLLLLFLTNVVRIVMLFWSGVALRTFWGFGTGTQLFQTVAHAHMGWILYLAVITIYLLLIQLLANSQRNQGQGDWAEPIVKKTSQLTSEISLAGARREGQPS